MYKQINDNSFINKITDKLFSYKWYKYNHLTVYTQMIDVKLFVLHSSTWNHLIILGLIANRIIYVRNIWNRLTVCKKSSGLLKNVIFKISLQILYI